MSSVLDTGKLIVLTFLLWRGTALNHGVPQSFYDLNRDTRPSISFRHAMQPVLVPQPRNSCHLMAHGKLRTRCGTVLFGKSRAETDHMEGFTSATALWGRSLHDAAPSDTPPRDFIWCEQYITPSCGTRMPYSTDFTFGILSFCQWGREAGCSLRRVEAIGRIADTRSGNPMPDPGSIAGRRQHLYSFFLQNFKLIKCILRHASEL